MLKTAAFILLAMVVGQGVQLPGPKVAHYKGLTNQAVEDRVDAYWQRAQEEVYKSPEELQAQANREKRRGQAVATLIRGNPGRKELALTFDDGPHPIYTLQLLDILKREKVPATFFVIGFLAERNPGLIKAESDGGFGIGNHTFSHVTLTYLPYKEIQTEYRACSDVVQKLTGKRPKYCRPPGGDYDRLVVQAAEAEGLVTTLWTDDPGDYTSPGTTVIEKDTLRKLSNGGVILLHDGVPETIQILPQIIESAKKRGFKFVTLDRLSGILP